MPLEQMRRIPTVGDLVDRDVLMLPENSDLLTGARLLVERQRSTAFVVDGNGRVTGALTDDDCLRILVPSALESQSSEAGFDEAALGSVAMAQHSLPATLTVGQDLFHAAKHFIDSKASVLPVVDGDRLVGGLDRLVLLREVDRTVSGVAAHQQRAQAEAASAGERPRSIERMQQVFARLTPRQLVRVMGRRRQEP